MRLTKKQKDLLYTKDGKLRSIVKRAKSAYRGRGIFRPVETGHRGGRGTVRDLTSDVMTVIKAFKYKYKTGNDAPRGGKSGNFIKISTSAGNRIKGLKAKL